MCYKNLEDLLQKLQRNSELAINWFEDNYKCLLLISGHEYEHQWAQISKNMVWEENQVKYLEITIDKLNFDSHILNICSTANKKLSALCRLYVFF